jgi:hypothetical protein
MHAEKSSVTLLKKKAEDELLAAVLLSPAGRSHHFVYQYVARIYICFFFIWILLYYMANNSDRGDYIYWEIKAIFSFSTTPSPGRFLTSSTYHICISSTPRTHRNRRPLGRSRATAAIVVASRSCMAQQRWQLVFGMAWTSIFGKWSAEEEH